MNNTRTRVKIIFLLLLVDSTYCIGYSQAPLNDECENAILLMCQDTIDLSIEFATISELNSAACQSQFSDLWYHIPGDNQYHIFDQLNFLQFPTFVSIFNGSCTDQEQLICINSFLLEQDFGPKSFFAELGQDYFISVSTNNVFEFLSFTHSCLDASENDECTTALELDCNQIIHANLLTASQSDFPVICDFSYNNELWYSIEGDDKYHAFEYITSQVGEINIHVYSGTCDNFYFNCIETLNVFGIFGQSFFAHAGITYLLRVSTGCCPNLGEFSFRHTCPTLPTNDLCENALPLECNQEININLLTATYSPINSDCTNFNTGDIWFTIQGDGLVKTFSRDIMGITRTSIDIYTQECGSDYSCEYQFNFNQDVFSRSFLAKAGITYYIRIYTSFGSMLPNFNMNYTCEPVPIEEIPTLSDWGFLCLTLLMLILSLLSIKQSVTEDKLTDIYG